MTIADPRRNPYGDAAIRPQMLHAAAHDNHAPLPGVMPTTIPGQGPPLPPSQPQLQQYPYTGPNGERPQLPHTAPLQINGAPRGDASTALVAPTPYTGVGPVMPSFGVAQPNPRRSRKVLLVIGGAAALLAAVFGLVVGRRVLPAEEVYPADAPEPESADIAVG